MRPTRVSVLYNTDYDAELTGPGIDVSSVEISARSIADALKTAGFTVELLGLAGLEVFDILARLRTSGADIVFNLCESMAGDPRNEPTFVGLLDLFGIPYTGSDLPALAACLHKRRSKDILLGRDIPTPPHRFLSTVTALEDPALDQLDYPWFLKLAHEDASIGITEENLVRTPAALRKRARAMMVEFDQPVLAERYIEGREINVTLIGNGADLQVLPLHEIDFSAMPAERPRIVSYAAKWEEDHVDYAGTKPVPLRDATPAFIAKCEAVARAAWDAHGLRDYARVDLRVDRDGNPWVIDVNPNPDISPDAGVARSAKVAGMSYVDLITKLTEIAWKRICSTKK
ncbi:MAG: ATP-grasp domain-containing protein [Kofleriaceae bacterium]|nr:ATP-grasp domain-containing protein [Kofleriaceae bacterium]